MFPYIYIFYNLCIYDMIYAPMIINLREVTSSQVSQNIVLSTPSLLDVKSVCVGMCAKIDEVPQESRHGWGNGGLCICYDWTALISWDLCWGTISEEGNQRGKLAANPESSFTDLSLGLWSHGQWVVMSWSFQRTLESCPGVIENDLGEGQAT